MPRTPLTISRSHKTTHTSRSIVSNSTLPPPAPRSSSRSSYSTYKSSRLTPFRARCWLQKKSTKKTPCSGKNFTHVVYCILSLSANTLCLRCFDSVGSNFGSTPVPVCGRWWWYPDKEMRYKEKLSSSPLFALRVGRPC
jgi:hypothetical protein